MTLEDNTFTLEYHKYFKETAPKFMDLTEGYLSKGKVENFVESRQQVQSPDLLYERLSSYEYSRCTFNSQKAIGVNTSTQRLLLKKNRDN